MGSFVSMEVACKTSCDEKVWIEGFTSLRAAQGAKSNANVFFASIALHRPYRRMLIGSTTFFNITTTQQHAHRVYSCSRSFAQRSFR